MAIERWKFTEGTDGPINGGGSYVCYLTVDYRQNGQAFLLFGEIDGTKRLIDTHFRFTGQGLPDVNGVCPAGQTLRVPETGEANGLRVDGGRDFTISVW